MPYFFPRLLTGAVTQYPLSKRRWCRSVVNRTVDGHTIRLADPESALVEWEMTLCGMSWNEAAVLEALYHAAEGRLGSFVFHDPTGNLLCWSEDFLQPVWEADPLLMRASGRPDPSESASATSLTNHAQVAQAVRQAIPGRGYDDYCFSIYVRSAVPSQVRLIREAGGHALLDSFPASPVWRRISAAGALPVDTGQVRFGVEIPAGASVEIFGAQVDAQGAPAPYRRTTARSGVHPDARFAGDELVMVCEGPDQYSARVRIVSRN